MNIKTVVIDRNVAKALRKIPSYIVEKLETWVLLVEMLGILKVRKIKSYHDEPLKGQKKGERSIRLNKAYRAFYLEHENDSLEISFIEITEVNKHDYR